MNNGTTTLQRGILKAGLEPGAPRWRSRGYLPHFESAEAIQHVTYHLADSLPTDVLARFEDELRAMPPERRLTDKRKRIEAWLDAGRGCCVLCEPTVAETVQSCFCISMGNATACLPGRSCPITCTCSFSRWVAGRWQIS
jgi:hypothetical protein